MKTQKCNKLDPLDAAWIAGFFDGEGYCGITRETKEKVALSIVQCDVETLGWIQNITGIGSICAQKKRSSNHTSCFIWQVQSISTVESFLEEIEMYLRTKHKKEQVEHVLTWCETRKDTNG